MRLKPRSAPIKVLGWASKIPSSGPGSDMQRRDFITLLGGAAALPLAARAQQPARRVYRAGYLSYGSREQQLSLFSAFEDGLRSLGYRIGENVVIEYRFTNAEIE